MVRVCPLNPSQIRSPRKSSFLGAISNGFPGYIPGRSLPLRGRHPPKMGCSRAAKHANIPHLCTVPIIETTVSLQALQPFKP